MADLLKADHTNEFLDDEEPYVPNENDQDDSEDDEDEELSEGDAEPSVTMLSPAGVSAAKRCPKRKPADNGDVESSPKKKIN